jgi:hypothetical protein
MDCRVKPGNDGTENPSRGAPQRPSFATTKPKQESFRTRLRQQKGGEAPKGAYRPRPRRTSGCRHPKGPARQRIQRDALAFRRFTAALATPVATSIGSAPEPGFPRQAEPKCFARLKPFAAV